MNLSSHLPPPALDASHKERKSHRQRRRHHKKRRSKSSASSCSSSSSSSQKRSKKRKRKYEKKSKRRRDYKDDSSDDREHKKRKSKKRQKKEHRSRGDMKDDIPDANESPKGSEECLDSTIANERVKNQSEPTTTPKPELTPPTISEAPKEQSKPTSGPMTQQQYQALQSQIHEVMDPHTGRTRWMRGTGEIVERIVSKQEHANLNAAATRGDGMGFSRDVLGALRGRK
jgi:hypothetical protein